MRAPPAWRGAGRPAPRRKAPGAGPRRPVPGRQQLVGKCLRRDSDRGRGCEPTVLPAATSEQPVATVTATCPSRLGP